MARLWRGPASWFADGLLLAVASHGGESKLWSLLPLVRTVIPSCGPTLMISSKPDYLPKAPTTTPLRCGWRGQLGLQYRNLGWVRRGDKNIQSMAEVIFQRSALEVQLYQCRIRFPTLFWQYLSITATQNLISSSLMLFNYIVGV